MPAVSPAMGAVEEEPLWALLPTKKSTMKMALNVCKQIEMAIEGTASMRCELTMTLLTQANYSSGSDMFQCPAGRLHLGHGSKYQE